MEEINYFDLDINDRAFNAIKAGKKKVEIRVTTDKKRKDYGIISAGDVINFSNSKNEILKCRVINNIWYKNEKELLMLEGTKYTLSSTDDFNEGVKSINSFKNYTNGINQNGIYAIHIEPIISKIYDMKLTKDNYDAIINGTKRVELRLNDEKRKLIKLNDYICFHLVDNNETFFKVQVIGLSSFNCIEELIDNYKIEKLLSKNINSKELINIFDKIYTKERQKKYGVLGISFKIVD